MSSAHPQKGLSLASLSLSLPADLAQAVKLQRESWDAAGNTQRLWQKDAGWLTIVEEQLANVSRFKSFAAGIAEDGFAHFVVLGMGGASLCADLFGRSFGKQPNAPQMAVLNSAEPAEIRALRAKIDPARTLFCVSSKSGHLQYFYEETRKTVGGTAAGQHFIAISDPGSKLEIMAQELGFRRAYHGVPGLDERYSALSDFGLIPHAGMGLDTERFLKRSQLMVKACQGTDAAANPGVSLGLVLATAAREFGRDKVTLICSPALRSFGAWVEQLLAEVCGLIPVDCEPLLTPDHYGSDRIFAYVHAASDGGDPNGNLVAALEKAGQPVIRIGLKDLYDLGQAIFQWQIATAVAASILGVNLFREPEPEASALAAEEPILSPALGGLIRKHLDCMKPKDYFGLLAYLPMFPEHEAALQEIRGTILEAKKAATILRFGPRFLPGNDMDSGVFLQITCEETDDLAIPGHEYTFGAVKAAQAQSDFQALAERHRRVLRVHLGKDVKAGLARLRDLVCAAVAH